MQAGTEEMVCEAGEHAAAMCCLLQLEAHEGRNIVRIGIRERFAEKAGRKA